MFVNPNDAEDCEAKTLDHTKQGGSIKIISEGDPTILGAYKVANIRKQSFLAPMSESLLDHASGQPSAGFSSSSTLDAQ